MAIYEAIFIQQVIFSSENVSIGCQLLNYELASGKENKKGDTVYRVEKLSVVKVFSWL